MFRNEGSRSFWWTFLPFFATLYILTDFFGQIKQIASLKHHIYSGKMLLEGKNSSFSASLLLNLWARSMQVFTSKAMGNSFPFFPLPPNRVNLISDLFDRSKAKCQNYHSGLLISNDKDTKLADLINIKTRSRGRESQSKKIFPKIKFQHVLQLPSKRLLLITFSQMHSGT